MAFVTLDGLIPVAHMHGHEHYAAPGVVIWCAAMATIHTYLGWLQKDKNKKILRTDCALTLLNYFS
jgi:hypothetical protein